MRAFILWLVVSLLLWTGAERWMDSHYRENPRLIVVALDTSFAMEPVWNAVPALLAGFDGAPYVRTSYMALVGGCTDHLIGSIWDKCGPMAQAPSSTLPRFLTKHISAF